jgi:hypothetical protein
VRARRGVSAVRIERRTWAGSGRLRDMGVGDRRGRIRAVLGAPRRQPEHGAGQPLRAGGGTRGRAAGTVGASAAWLQQFGVCASQLGMPKRTFACDAGNAAREHVDDGTRRPRRRQGGYPSRRQRSKGAASARGSTARSGPQRLGRRGGRGRTTGIACSDFVVRAWRAVARLQAVEEAGMPRRAGRPELGRASAMPFGGVLAPCRRGGGSNALDRGAAGR